MLGAAALMIGAIGFAQTPVTDSSGGGSTNTADLAQEEATLPGAPATANRNRTIQGGTDNIVEVGQVGTRQSVYTRQVNGSGTGGNDARVMQTGLVTPGVSGERNMAEVLQDGTTNDSDIDQNGDRNNAVSHQGQNDDGSVSNRSYIRQGANGAQKAERNAAAAYQDGNRNQSRIIQTFDKNSAWTMQNGDDNKSRINQNAAPNGTFGHRALVTQIGDANQADIDQNSGAGAENEAEIHQLGNGNIGQQTQTTDVAAGPNQGNDALINQGDDSRWDNSALKGSIYASLEAVQNDGGPSNGDNSFNGIAIQNQGGSLNVAESHQFGADAPQGSNFSEQLQGMNDATSRNNDAYIVQNAYGNVAGGNNYAYQAQDGDNNKAGISQRNNGHQAAQMQDGNDNETYSTQRGAGHRVNTNQWGDDNHSTTAQSGSMNVSLVNQTDGQSSIVEQGLAVPNPNSSNSAHIYQAGPGGGMDPGMSFGSNAAPGALPNLGALNLSPL